MKSISHYIHNPKGIFVGLLTHYMYWIPETLFLRILFRLRMGKKLNLKNPQTFSEKLQWLKLYNRKPEYTTMVDKYAVKDYVAKIIGKEYIIPTLGVWDKPEDIEWDKLPDKFVLKCTHDSGTIIICKDKSKLNKQETVKKLRKWLKRDYYRQNKEWPYKNVPRRIIAEQFMEENSNSVKKDLPDYKFFCFNGEPKVLLYCTERKNGTSKWDFFDMDMNRMPMSAEHHPTTNKIPDIDRATFEKLKETARRLAKDTAYISVDLYRINNQTYFGELTFFSGSGMLHFQPQEWDKHLGDLLTLPVERIGGGYWITVSYEDIKMKEDKKDLPDYKFFCFNGEPKFCQVITGRESKMCVDFFDKDWNHQAFHEPRNYPFADVEPQKPQNYEQMWNAARELAGGREFSRIDFYEVNKQTYFGEITFYPTSGMGGFSPEEYDKILGKMITLPTEINGGGVLDNS